MSNETMDLEQTQRALYNALLCLLDVTTEFQAQTTANGVRMVADVDPVSFHVWNATYQEHEAWFSTYLGRAEKPKPGLLQPKLDRLPLKDWTAIGSEVRRDTDPRVFLKRTETDFVVAIQLGRKWHQMAPAQAETICENAAQQLGDGEEELELFGSTLDREAVSVLLNMLRQVRVVLVGARAEFP